MKRDYIYIAIILLALGAGAFGAVKYGKENRQLKRQNKDLEKINVSLGVKVDSLTGEITERNEFIATSTASFDSLQNKLVRLNDKRIVTNFPTIISTLDFDEQIQLLSEFLRASDSLWR